MVLVRLPFELQFRVTVARINPNARRMNRCSFFAAIIVRHQLAIGLDFRARMTRTTKTQQQIVEANNNFWPNYIIIGADLKWKTFEATTFPRRPTGKTDEIPLCGFVAADR